MHICIGSSDTCLNFRITRDFTVNNMCKIVRKIIIIGSFDSLSGISAY